MRSNQKILELIQCYQDLKTQKNALEKTIKEVEATIESELDVRNKELIEISGHQIKRVIYESKRFDNSRFKELNKTLYDSYLVSNVITKILIK